MEGKGFLLDLLRYRDDWWIISNMESGAGYTNIVIEIFAEKIEVVIEVKYANNGKLDACCQREIAQIEKIRYDGMETVIKFGITCYGQGCRGIVK